MSKLILAVVLEEFYFVILSNLLTKKQERCSLETAEFFLSKMATLRNKRKLAAVTREAH